MTSATPEEFHVLVTGASRGIGLALVRAFQLRGARVTACVRDAGGVDPELTALAAAPASRVTVLALDVASDASARAAAAHPDAPPYVNVLVNNAAINGGAQRAPGMDLARAARIVDTNAVGPLRVYDAFIAKVRAAPGVRTVVNVSSESGSLGSFRASSKPEYAMSKAALNALTRWVAVQEREHGVCCVSLDPGWTQTRMGGAGATHTPEQTAARLCTAIEQLTPAHSGGFFDAELRPLAW